MADILYLACNRFWTPLKKGRGNIYIPSAFFAVYRRIWIVSHPTAKAGGLQFEIIEVVTNREILPLRSASSGYWQSPFFNQDLPDWSCRFFRLFTNTKPRVFITRHPKCAEELYIHSSYAVIIGMITTFITDILMYIMMSVLFMYPTTFWTSLTCIFRSCLKKQ